MYLTARSPGIDRLSLAERILLVEEIWDSIAAEAEMLEAPHFYRDELDRRLAAFSADPHAGESWKDVKAHVRKQTGVGP